VSRPLVAALLVTLWLGAALLTVAVVAPGAFAVLPTRALAGDVVGYVLPVVFAGAIVVPVLALVLDPSARRSMASVLGSACAILAAVTAFAVIDPRVAALRRAAVVPIDQLSPADPRRTMFGLLHASSVALLGVAMVGLVLLLVSRARATVRGVPPSGEVQ
jgi:hypothetical protein